MSTVPPGAKLCETCGGEGWYTRGAMDTPEQVQCDDCNGRGWIESLCSECTAPVPWGVTVCKVCVKRIADEDRADERRIERRNKTED